MINNENPIPVKGLSAALMRGTLWTVAMRWGVRLLGILNMLVLVRLLEAGDFGLIAMAMTIVALVDQLTDFGIAWVLIRDKNAGRVEFDTAWTVRQGQLVVVAVAAILAAPFAADFYNDVRVSAVLQIIGLSFVIRGFENIGVIEFQRELRFDMEFKFRVAVKLLSMVATIILAFWLRNYWALALGLLSRSIIGVLCSYVMSDYRPRWTLAGWKKIWGFSQWILSQGIAKFLYERSPILFLGRLTTAESVGYYTVSNEIASLPASEVSLPVSRAVLPGLAKLADQPLRMKRGYLKAFGAVATVTIPLGLGVASIATELVYLILGTQWLPAIGLIQIFSFFAVFRALDSLSGNLLVVIDRVRSFSAISWAQAVLMLLTIVPMYRLGALEGVATARAITSFVGLALFVAVISKLRVASSVEVVKVLVRPVLAGLAMTAAILAIDKIGSPQFTAVHLTFTLLAKVTTGIVVYSTVLAGTWLYAGRPDGLETMLAEKLPKLIHRSR